jgi:nickel transport protein
MRSTLGLLAVIFLFSGYFLSPAWAHKVNIFAYAEGDKIYTESYFANGQKVNSGEIEVVDAAGNRLLTGTTDANGLFVFPLTKKQNLTIIVNAGMGHKNRYVLQREEM